MKLLNPNSLRTIWLGGKGKKGKKRGAVEGVRGKGRN